MMPQTLLSSVHLEKTLLATALITTRTQAFVGTRHSAALCEVPSIKAHHQPAR